MTSIGPWRGWDEQPERVERRVLLLPGRGYTAAHPLLHWSATALHERGWWVHAAAWEADAFDDDNDARQISLVEQALTDLLDQAPAAAVTVVVAKSVGTLAAAAASRAGLPAVWLTPLVQHPQVASSLAEYPVASLVIGGSGDPSWDSAASVSGERREIADADHSLETGHWRASMQAHREVVALIEEFADALLDEQRDDT